MNTIYCACGRNNIYEKCCGEIHKSIELALTAEDLMRSRYSAYTLANSAYLQKSHHSSTRPSKRESRNIEVWAKSVTWIKLEVLNTTLGSSNDSKGTVEFKAYYMEYSNVEVIHEKSYFEKEKGIWTYKSAL